VLSALRIGAEVILRVIVPHLIGWSARNTRVIRGSPLYALDAWAGLRPLPSRY
jgi:hypothetical protein